MSKKKICFVAQFPPPMHGLSKAVETLYNSTLSEEYDFEKIDISDNKKILGVLKRIRRSNADLFYFTISQSVSGNKRDLLIMKAIGKRPCLIHLHGGYYRTLVDNDMRSWQRKLNYRTMRRADGVIVLGPSLKFIFQGMVPEKKILTVQNCVDDEYLMDDLQFENKINTLSRRKVKHVLYLSNFIRSKGYPDVLRLARIEKKRGGERRFHFDFAGNFFDKNEESYFFNYIKKYGLDDYVTYHGVVDGNEKRKLLQMCDVFCLLTNYPNEGQPISILEAMGNGMVVVTTDHAGIPDLVIDGENGIVEEKNNISTQRIYSRLLNVDYETIEKTNRHVIDKAFLQCTYITNMGKIFKNCV